MKLLKDILYKAGLNDVIGPTNVAIESVHFDSREVVGYSLFVAIKGIQTDGHEYIRSALSSGAIAIVCEVLPETLHGGITYVKVEDAAIALAHISGNFYDHPSSKLKLIGITGTNGKTTVATLLWQLFTALGHKTALLSTVVNKIGDKEIPATHTTPDVLSLNKLLDEMVQEGVEYCFMEVSSHALVQHRVTGIEFNIGIFTNITHDHLDYHKTFDEYIKAKKIFFDALPEDAVAIVNHDDSHSEIMVQNCKAKKETFAVKSFADHRAKIIENQFNGIHILIDGNDLYTKLIGSFNTYNLLAVYATAIALGKDKLEVLTQISALEPVEGRFQHIRTEKNISAIVDYAHTPDALKNVLKTILDISTGNEKVITVVGCGGNRDRSKRPVMAKIACEYSDKVIFTSDNPRNEDPDAILKDINSGVDGAHFKKTLTIKDRREAIKAAVDMAVAGDILLIAGKGHEKYQEIQGVKYPFDDYQIVQETLKLMEK
ncbi:MAG: UDP-N-acetylmuramoyl-L-alanyl-D-glutamate--2,6-diaminopimelate ligase [Flavobacteriales bacterium]|nr:UDP-N-acetylmuramoyl-L-alanyl-D-glutamate--2,6-diaminopimelate ligase [Flavobacteriales bacterium]